MSSSLSYSDIELPSDRLAELRTISLYELQAGSASERELLLKTCIEDGFFCLDLTHPSLSSLLSDVDAIFDLSKDLFDSSDDVKSSFDVDKISDLKTNGYKPKGRNVVGNGKDGRTDGFESWVLPRNGILELSNDPFPHPPAIAHQLPALRGFVNGLGSAAQTIFSALSTSLSLPDGQRLEDFQRESCPAPDILRLLKYHANTSTDLPQTPHTDLGSLTFVFSTTPGLQVLPVGLGQKPGSYSDSDWRYVTPRPGHAVVNIGDCVSIMTNGLLKSALHRVGPVEGRSMPERYSAAYLMRPEDETVLRVLDSPLIPRSVYDGQDPITSGEWIRRKFKALRGQKDAGNFDQVLTGGRGVLV